MTTLWVIALIINGVSIIGDQAYTSEDDCEKAASVAVGIQHSCVAIYKGKSGEPGFACPLDTDWQCEQKKSGRV